MKNKNSLNFFPLNFFSPIFSPVFFLLPNTVLSQAKGKSCYGKVVRLTKKGK